ncbi:unnamed protein product [Sympodiomycopsis kandeliae]
MMITFKSSFFFVAFAAIAMGASLPPDAQASNLIDRGEQDINARFSRQGGSQIGPELNKLKVRFDPGNGSPIGGNLDVTHRRSADVHAASKRSEEEVVVMPRFTLHRGGFPVGGDAFKETQKQDEVPSGKTRVKRFGRNGGIPVADPYGPLAFKEGGNGRNN